MPTIGVTGKITGTTTDSYIVVFDWDSRWLAEKTIVISNTHSTNDLHYKIIVRGHYDGQDFEQVAETLLSATKQVRVSLNHAYARIKLQLKAAIAGNQATYQVDYIGNSAR